MKRLLLLALVAAAAWYGWKNYPGLFQKRGSHELVIENSGTANLQRVRVTVGGQTLVKEVIPAGGKESMPFLVDQDASFVMIWQTAGQRGERNWAGGMVPKGPMTQRHRITIDDEGQVMYRAENKGAPAP